VSPGSKRPAGEVALVTGGETGLGEAIVQALRKDGFRVRTASRRSGFDLTEGSAIERLVAGLDRLDLLVNNAGIAESAPLERTTDDLWERHFAINAKAPFRLARAAYPLLRKASRGRLIQVASTAALRGSPYIAAYAASKHALLGLTRVLAAEWRDVAVHALCPGFLDTPLTARAVARIASSTEMSEKQAREFLAAQNASGRLLRPEEVAEALLELVHDPGTGRELVLE